MDQNSLRDSPLLVCKCCGHLDSAELSNIAVSNLCCLCDPDIAKWHGVFSRQQPADRESPISEDTIELVLGEHPEYVDVPANPGDIH